MAPQLEKTETNKSAEGDLNRESLASAVLPNNDDYLRLIGRPEDSSAQNNLSIYESGSETEIGNGATQSYNQDGTVVTKLVDLASGKEHSITFDQHSGKYTDGEGKEASPLSLPVLAEQLTPASGENIQHRVQHNLDGTTTYKPLVSRPGQPDKTVTIFPTNDLHGRSSSITEKLDNLTTIQTDYRDKYEHLQFNKKSYYNAQSQEFKQEIFIPAENSTNGANITQTVEGDHLTTSFNPPQRFGNQEVSALVFDSGKQPVLIGKDGQPLAISPDNDPQLKADLDKFLSTPLNKQGPLADSKIFAGRIPEIASPNHIIEAPAKFETVIKHDQLPAGYSLKQTAENKWQLLNAKNEPAAGETIPALQLTADSNGEISGQFESSKLGDLRYKDGRGMETALRANGNRQIYNMRDYSRLTTTATGETKTDYWNGKEWLPGEKQESADGSVTITFENSDPTKPSSVTRTPGAENDPEGGQLLINYGDGSKLLSDWRQQTQQTINADGTAGTVRHFDGTSYRETEQVTDNNNIRSIRFKNDGAGPSEVEYDIAKRETTSIYRNNQAQEIARVTRNSAGYVNAIQTPQGKTEIVRDSDGDINKITLADGSVYRRTGQERIPGEAARMLRMLNPNAAQVADAPLSSPDLLTRGLNRWEGQTPDGKQMELQGNFLTATDGTIILDKGMGSSTLTYPTKIIEQRSAGKTIGITDAAGNAFDAVPDKHNEYVARGSSVSIKGEPIKMPDGTVRFRSVEGEQVYDTMRNAADPNSYSKIDAFTGKEVSRHYDNQSALLYGPEGIVASVNAKQETSHYTYKDGKLDTISSEANGQGKVLAQADASGVLQELDPITQNPTGRRVSVDQRSGDLLFHKENANEPDEVRRIDASSMRPLAGGVIEKTLASGQKIRLRKAADGSLVPAEDSTS
ncbi:MAG: hypothetical protein K2W82_14720 [Candidatus Obscuribacterales bacterium]|nr:hypothetical protein [Candidatus Obscuribacterales bacterium]